MRRARAALVALLLSTTCVLAQENGLTGPSAASCAGCTTNSVLLWSGAGLANSSISDNGTTVSTTEYFSAGATTITGSFTATGLVTNADLVGSIAASKLVGTDIVTVGALAAGSIASGFGTILTVNPITGANLISTGYGAVTGTTLPTQAAGILGLGGVAAVPTLGATSEGDIYLTSVNGTNIIGEGSTYDVALLNDLGTVVLGIIHGIGYVYANELFVGSNSYQNASDLFAVAAPANGLKSITLANSNVGSSASMALYFRNNTSTTEASLILNSSANVGGNGANSFTINGAVGVWLQYAGTNALQTTTGGGLTLLAGTASLTFASTTYDSCTALTTTSGGVLGCTASSVRLKNPKGWLSDTNALVGVEKIEPAIWSYRDSQHYGPRAGDFIGPYAEEVCELDERLCIRDAVGRPKDYDTRGVVAYLWGAVRAQQAEIVALQRSTH